MATITRTGTVAIGRLAIVRAGTLTSARAASATADKINPVTHRGTIALGRPGPTRTGTTASEAAPSGSRTVTGATTLTRTGATVSAAAPSASRTVTPLGATQTRSGTVTFGRIAIVRSGATHSPVALSGSWILGNPGATLDRAGLVVAGRLAKIRSGSTTSAAQPSASSTVVPRGTVDRRGGGAGGQGQPTGGLLLTLQSHPGFTLTASRRVDSNVPARNGTITSQARAAASRVTRRDRTGALISLVLVAGSKQSAGNRNRNGTTTTRPIPGVSRILSHISDRAGTVTAPAIVSASGGRGVLQLVTRNGTTTIRLTVAASRQVRPRAGRSFIYPPIATGRISDPRETGVLVP